MVTARQSWSWCEGTLSTTAAYGTLLILAGAVMIGCEPDRASEDVGRLVSPTTTAALTASRTPAPTPSTDAGGGANYAHAGRLPDPEPDSYTNRYARSTPEPTASPSPTPTQTASPSPTPTPRGPAVVIGSTVFDAELAIAPAERVKGLSGWDSLPPQTGMLFIFETGEATAFWMRGMRFPLDFVWISKDCAVADITHHAPAPENDSTDLPAYESAAQAAYNFEINAGEAEKYGIEVGEPGALLRCPSRERGPMQSNRTESIAWLNRARDSPDWVYMTC